MRARLWTLLGALTACCLVPGLLWAAPVVKHLRTGDGVKDKVLQGEARRFKAGQTVFAHLELDSAGADVVRIVWLHAGEIRKRARLRIGKSPRWRTWSKRAMKAADAGAWRIDAMDKGGEVLASTTFQVGAVRKPPPTTTEAVPERAAPERSVLRGSKTRAKGRSEARSPKGAGGGGSGARLTDLPPKVQSLLRAR